MTDRRRAWAAGNPGNAAIRDEVARAALTVAEPAIRGDCAILDAGCGNGWWLQRLAAEGVAPERLHGIELVERRSRNAAAAVPGAAILPGDVRALPYPDATFTAVFAFTVLSSVGDDVATAVREARRVLAPGGVLIVWEPRVPTANPDTRRIRARDLGATDSTTLTLLPPLARRLGRATPRLYAPLARIPLLRTHRLYTVRR